MCRYVILYHFLFPYSFCFFTGVTTGTHNHPKNSEPTRRQIFMGKPDSTDRLKPLPSSKTPTVFLQKWLDTKVLTHDERKLFREYSDDPENLLSTEHEDHLKICESRFRFGVVSSQDIKVNELVGNYFGRLTRELPDDARYSLNILRSSKLFCSAEVERPLLAYVANLLGF